MCVRSSVSFVRSQKVSEMVKWKVSSFFWETSEDIQPPSLKDQYDPGFQDPDFSRECSTLTGSPLGLDGAWDTGKARRPPGEEPHLRQFHSDQRRLKEAGVIFHRSIVNYPLTGPHTCGFQGLEDPPNNWLWGNIKACFFHKHAASWLPAIPPHKGRADLKRTLWGRVRKKGDQKLGGGTAVRHSDT